MVSMSFRPMHQLSYVQTRYYSRLHADPQYYGTALRDRCEPATVKIAPRLPAHFQGRIVGKNYIRTEFQCNLSRTDVHFRPSQGLIREKSIPTRFPLQQSGELLRLLLKPQATKAASRLRSLSLACRRHLSGWPSARTLLLLAPTGNDA